MTPTMGRNTRSLSPSATAPSTIPASTQGASENMRRAAVLRRQ